MALLHGGDISLLASRNLKYSNGMKCNGWYSVITSVSQCRKGTFHEVPGVYLFLFERGYALQSKK